MKVKNLFEREVSEGHSVFKIKGDDFGDYFFTNRPVATTWYDCGGSAAKYLCSSRYDPAIQRDIHDELVGILNSGNPEDFDTLKTALLPFLQVFVSGKYAIRLIDSELEQSDTPPHHALTTEFPEYLYFIMSSEAKPELEIQYLDNALAYFEKNQTSSLRLRNDIMFTCTYNFYDALEFSLIATLPIR